MQMIHEPTPLSADTRVRMALSLSDYHAASTLRAKLETMGISVTLADARVLFQSANKAWSDAMSERLVS